MKTQKTTIVIIAVVAYLALVSCEKETPPVQLPGYQTIQISSLPADIDNVKAYLYPLDPYNMSFDENSDFAVIGEADVVNGGFTLNMSKDIPSDLLSPISKSNNLKYMTDLFISDETAKLGEIRIWGFLGDKKKGYFSCSTELGNMIYIYTDRKVTLRGKVAIPPQLGYNEIKYDMDLWAGFERYERYLNKHYTEDKSAVVIENLCFSTSIQYYTSTTWSFKRTY